MAWPNSSNACWARVRSEGLSVKGVELPPRLLAPFGVWHIVATLAGQLNSSEPVPQTCSKKNLYWLSESLYTTHAVSGLAISSGSTGGSWACSADEFCKR